MNTKTPKPMEKEEFNRIKAQVEEASATTLSVHEQLVIIQRELKAPKNQVNSFGKYKYRSCEDILEAVKPLLGDCVLTINDEIVQIGDRFYVKATAQLGDMEGNYRYASALARESLEKKGMDSAQVTGATSSYARKYALNGLFLIDDTKDADTDEAYTSSEPVVTPIKKEPKLTGDQMLRINKLISVKGLKHEDVKYNIKTKLNKDNIFDLTPDEANTVMIGLEKLPDYDYTKDIEQESIDIDEVAREINK